MFTRRCVHTIFTLSVGMLLFHGVASGQTLYADGNQNGEIYQISNYAFNPTAVPVGDVGFALTDIAQAPNGTGYGITLDSLYRINLSTANATFISSENVSLNALLAASNSTLYAMGPDTTDLYRINTKTGAESVVFDTGYSSGGDLAFGANGKELYLATPQNELVRINLANDTATDIGSFGPNVDSIYGLGVIHGVLYAGSADANLYTVNTSTGQATLIGNIAGAEDYGLGGMAVSPSIAAVPEASSVLALAGLFCFGSLLLLRRKHTRACPGAGIGLS